MSLSAEYKDSFEHNGCRYEYFNINKLDNDKVAVLPFSIRVLLECAIRNYDNFQFTKKHINDILNWSQTQQNGVEIPFKPSRVLLQDFTGVPAIVDFAAMRDCVKELGGNPRVINPVCPADLVIDHSVQVDHSGDKEALRKNEEIEFNRNQERFSFLKWGADNLDNVLIVPPGSGIVHQVNLEYLARVVFGVNDNSRVLYPDSVVGTDSHTTMINGLGVLGWGVGGIEAEAVMLDQPVNLLLPPVTGFKMTGKLAPGTTSTDLVLTVTNQLRSVGVVGSFVEFFGEGVAQLTIADRATVANMCPEYGATCGYFPLDEASLQYLLQTGRSKESVDIMRKYLTHNNLLVTDYSIETSRNYSRVVELDISTVKPCLAGPKRPHDRVLLDNMKQEFAASLTAPMGFKGFNIPPADIDKSVKITVGNNETVELHHGSVVIAAITSCTNTSNPSVMLGAALLARNAIKKGLSVGKAVKTSLAPGSGVVTKYLEKSGLSGYLDQLGFHTVGYGCTTCIGNSGPLLHDAEVSKAIEDNGLVTASVLSGNRNFEGRVHPLTRANYLASPPLVVAYALAGTVQLNFETDPIGHNSSNGEAVYLSDIWPSSDEIRELETATIIPSMFREVYDTIRNSGSQQWHQLPNQKSELYPWQQDSTYIRLPPFFKGMTHKPNTVIQPIEKARILLNLGDSITTDHISPAGSIARNSPAARYLGERGIKARDFNSYGSRRGNDEIMSRGTFANVRIYNKLMSLVDSNKKLVGPRTLYLPSRQEMDVWDCAEQYKKDGVSVVVLAGKEYGSGSSRDWAAKGPYLLGVRAVIAESFERIHRSNLIGMGILPLQYNKPGVNADSLGLNGEELISIKLENLFTVKPRQQLVVVTDTGVEFEVLCRLDTEVEVEYYQNGGILQFMVRKLMASGTN